MNKHRNIARYFLIKANLNGLFKPPIVPFQCVFEQRLGDIVCDCSNPYPVIVTVPAIFHADELLNGLTEIGIHFFVVLADHVQIVNIALWSSLFHG